MLNEKRVYDFIDAYQLRCGVESRFIDLTSEIGELGKEILKGTEYHTREFAPTAGLSGKVGDCVFSLLALCQELGIDAEAALREALDKYGARMAKAGRIGSGND